MSGAPTTALTADNGAQGAPSLLGGLGWSTPRSCSPAPPTGRTARPVEVARARAPLSRRLRALLVRLLRDLRGLVVADVRCSAPSPASASRCTSSAMRSRLGSMPTAQCSSKLTMPSASRRTLCSKLCAIIGRNTLSSKLPQAPPKLIATSLPNTCAASMVSASHCVGLTLPGMIEEPGSFSGMLSSPMPQRGPLASQRTSLAIFIMLAASVLSAPCACTSASTRPAPRTCSAP